MSGYPNSYIRRKHQATQATQVHIPSGLEVLSSVAVAQQARQVEIARLQLAQQAERDRESAKKAELERIQQQAMTIARQQAKAHAEANGQIWVDPKAAASYEAHARRNGFGYRGGY